MHLYRKANTNAFLSMPCVLQCEDDELHKFDNMWFSDETKHDADWVNPAFSQFYGEVDKGTIDPEGVAYELPCKVKQVNIKTYNCELTGIFNATEYNVMNVLNGIHESNDSRGQCNGFHCYGTVSEIRSKSC